ncbi:MAG: phosphopantetheine adenylyltransferase [Sinobacteraceae bacterium]|nr:phosphopantetheine adenylyltransferase [Nevskiaceae bacterium]
MRYVLSAMLTIVGVIHLLPLSGVLGVSRLQALYGVTIADPNLEILMRHRAVLFGILGAFLIYAAFRPSYQLMALIAGSVSVISFLVIAGLIGGYNTGIARVVSADVLAVICLLIAAFAYWKDRATIGVNG